MTFKSPSYIYGTEYDYENTINYIDLNNKLFCTFTTLEDLDELINSITKRYEIMYNKMFCAAKLILRILKRERLMSKV